MNLRIPDAPGLVAFLHGVVSDSGTVILSSDGFHVVEIDGLVFYHRSDPVTVGGPFESVEHLVRSEGIRRFPKPERGSPDASRSVEEPPPVEEPRSMQGPPRVEIVEWASSFFRIEREGGGGERIGRYGSLEAAREG